MSTFSLAVMEAFSGSSVEAPGELGGGDSCRSGAYWRKPREVDGVSRIGGDLVTGSTGCLLSLGTNSRKKGRRGTPARCIVTASKRRSGGL
jgi:hypothetical protein